MWKEFLIGVPGKNGLSVSTALRSGIHKSTWFLVLDSPVEVSIQSYIIIELAFMTFGSSYHGKGGLPITSL